MDVRAHIECVSLLAKTGSVYTPLHSLSVRQHRQLQAGTVGSRGLLKNLLIPL